MAVKLEQQIPGNLTDEVDLCLQEMQSVPLNQKGALKRFAGKRIRLVCGGKSNRYSGRYYYAKPVNG